MQAADFNCRFAQQQAGFWWTHKGSNLGPLPYAHLGEMQKRGKQSSDYLSLNPIFVFLNGRHVAADGRIRSMSDGLRKAGLPE